MTEIVSVGRQTNVQPIDQIASAVGAEIPGLPGKLDSVKNDPIKMAFLDSPVDDKKAAEYFDVILKEYLPDPLKGVPFSKECEFFLNMLCLTNRGLKESGNEKDREEFNKICKRIRKDPSAIEKMVEKFDERKFPTNLRKLFSEYGEKGCDKIRDRYKEVCEEAWQHNHANYDTTKATDTDKYTPGMKCLDSYCDGMKAFLFENGGKYFALPDYRARIHGWKGGCLAYPTLLKSWSPSAEPENSAVPSEKPAAASERLRGAPENSADPLEKLMAGWFRGGGGVINYNNNNPRNDTGQVQLLSELFTSLLMKGERVASSSSMYDKAANNLPDLNAALNTIANTPGVESGERIRLMDRIIDQMGARNGQLRIIDNLESVTGLSDQTSDFGGRASTLTWMTANSTQTEPVKAEQPQSEDMQNASDKRPVGQLSDSGRGAEDPAGLSGSLAAVNDSQPRPEEAVRSADTASGNRPGEQVAAAVDTVQSEPGAAVIVDNESDNLLNRQDAPPPDSGRSSRRNSVSDGTLQSGPGATMTTVTARGIRPGEQATQSPDSPHRSGDPAGLTGSPADNLQPESGEEVGSADTVSDNLLNEQAPQSFDSGQTSEGGAAERRPQSPFQPVRNWNEAERQSVGSSGANIGLVAETSGQRQSAVEVGKTVYTGARHPDNYAGYTSPKHFNRPLQKTTERPQRQQERENELIDNPGGI